MTRRLTPRGRERRAQLMAYAVTRFAESGYHTTSVADIVSGLGVGKGVFYWYFESKEQLFLEILREAQNDLRRRQQQAIADEADPVRRLELGIRASMRWAAEHRDHNTLIRFAATDERFLPALRRGEEIAIADIARHVRDGVGAGRIRDADVDMVAHAMLGVTSQLARVYIHQRGDDPDRVADVAVAFVLDGLRGDRAPGDRRVTRAS